MSTAIPKRWPDAVLSSWPDVLEVYRNEETGETEAYFIVQRKNARSFTLEQTQMLEQLEELGLNVRIRFGPAEMTLEQFNAGSGTTSVSKQVVYNTRGEIKHLNTLLEGMAPTDARRWTLIEKKQRLEAKLGEITSMVIPSKQVAESDAQLDKIAEAVKNYKLEEDPIVLKREKETMEVAMENERKTIAELEQVISQVSGPTRVNLEKSLKDAREWLATLETRYNAKFGENK